MGTYSGVSVEARPDVKEEGAVVPPSATTFGITRVVITDSAGNPVGLSDPTEAPGASEDSPAHVTGEVEITGRPRVRPDLSRFPNGRLPVDTGLVIPPPAAVPAPVVIPKPRILDRDTDSVDVSGSTVELQGRPYVRPDLSRFGGRMPVDPGPVTLNGPVDIGNFPEAPAPPRPRALDFERDRVDASGSTVAISEMPKVRFDLSRLPGGVLPVGLGPLPTTIQTLEYEFGTAAATDFKLLDVATGTRVVVLMADFLLSGACSANALVRIGFGANSSSTTLAAIGTVAGIPTAAQMVLTHPKVAPGSGVIRGDGTAAIAVGGDGCDLFLTCGASTGGKARCLITYYTVPT